MIPRSFSDLLRYGLYFAIFILLAALPWVFSMVSSPLPVDLQMTGTALAATRTARLVAPPVLPGSPETPGSLKEPGDLDGTVESSLTSTTAASTTPTYTQTLTPTLSSSPTETLTPKPMVLGITSETVETYFCPGVRFQQGHLIAGEVFTIQGWDQTEEDGEIVTWILIEDEIGKPQKWVQESEFLVITSPDYQDVVPQISCRLAD